MNPDDTCKELPRFLDGDMSAEEQVRFREHLAGCEACSEAFREALQLELLGQMTEEEEPVRASGETRRPRAPFGRWKDRRTWLAGGSALAAVLLVALFVAVLGRQRAADVAWLVPKGGRHLEARLTYEAVDRHYRRYVPDRSGADTAARVAALPLHELARMEAREDLHGIATAYLLHGAPRQAMAFLAQMPDSPDKHCDAAVIALEQARLARDGDMNGALLKQTHLDAALGLLDEVLREEPDHPQALWNRALVLREMGLTLLAAEAFEAVARRAEPGWSEEAWSQARKLRDETLAHEREWKEAYAATRDLVTDPAARLPLEEARQYPGIVRLVFYDAVRAAPTREAVLRLLPVAKALDLAYSGRVPDDRQPGDRGPRVEDYVRRVAERDFTRRGPAARSYGLYYRGELPATSALAEELRRSGEEDILLGLLVHSGTRVATDLEELARLADAREDPWMQLQAERELAAHDSREGAWWKAEQRLLRALEACQRESLAYRCLGLERELTDLYLDLHRPADALRHAWSGWTRAKDAREWRFEQEFLQELADVARYQHAFASARAYLEESQARMPEDCEQRTHIQASLASVEWRSFRPDSARRALDRALACQRPLGLTGAFVLSDLARSRPQPRDGDHLRRSLAELRRPGVSRGREALLLFIEGQFALARSHAEGEAVLWRAIELAEPWPEDVEARKARAYAYDVLIAEEGRAGRWSEALAMLGRQLRMESVPTECLVAVSIHHERTLVLAQGASGRLHGYFDDTRTRPLDGTETLVPKHLVAELRGCEHVDVLALPPVHGLTGLLPMDLAWSYRVGRGARSLRPPAEGPGTHLVVTRVAAPASLRLPRLDMLEPPRVPDPLRVELQGTQATPARVLEGMVEASEVELHAHGMFSPAVSDASLVVLAPDGDGRYALTADRVRQTRLRHAPLVLLVACSAARTAPFRHEPFSLPGAFIQAGARVVLASTVDIPDTAGAFFEAVRERIRGGARPSLALRDTRTRWLMERPADGKWLNHVLLFE
ncbi:CHAT domain-containing protein [Myxococcus sp. RHSTA-1-4]|uniref:CHAT domain-containing protein n=1 Tax=Myxococcus sp. RHSTA-1-4 TaxID=2874601 RepID=UPI001CBDC786|nr:CHAT domain-containing protein [Myxococcus sp. RHSTA-1-4]MBZ4422429.1 CHAT domain-containing protein [Myxococcus sp. RHSTA-1-4]